MRRIHLFAIVNVLILISSCTPTIYKQIKNTYPPITTNQITVYEMDQKINNRFEDLGTYKIENSDFSSLSSYEKIISYAKEEAKKIGGNAVKIIEHIKPHTEMVGLGVVFTTTHDVVFKILKVSETEFLSESDSTKNQSNNAILNFYEQKSIYSGYKKPDLIESIALSRGYGYQIKLDDSLIVKMGEKWKKSIVLTEKIGNHKIIAKIKEGNLETPIDIQRGKEYYFRLRYTNTARRVFELVNNEIGEFEFDK